MTTRRGFIGGGIALALGATAQAREHVMRSVPITGTGEALPVIGLGTSRVFNVGEPDVAGLAGVVETLFAHGGRVIDTSPMYGRAEAVTGKLLATARGAEPFVATKVWINGRERGITQMNESHRLLGRLDLVQVHNLRDWREHLPVLREWQAEGRIRYIGITTSRAAQYEEFASVMRAERLDFVQLNYSAGEREAEKELLPLASERGIMTLINRPFMRGSLLRNLSRRVLPGFAAELGCRTWAQLLIKYILAHPACHCVIPATASPLHMQDNCMAGMGDLPEPRQRRAIEQAVASL